MKIKHLVWFGAFVFLEGILAFVFVHLMQLDAGRGNLLNYQILRPILEILVALFLLGLGFFLVRLLWNSAWAKKVCSYLDEKLTGEKGRLFFIQGLLIVLFVFLLECFCLTYFAFPVPMRPLFLWGALICLQAWLGFRLAYATAYRTRPSFWSVVKTKWQEWTPVQRKTFIVIAGIGLLYFLAFVPLNYLRDKLTHFYIHPDESLLYVEVTKAMIGQGSFEATLRNFLGWQYYYGFPYFIVSAAVLAIPRLIFGEAFVQQQQLNIFLLRQFVSVLPIILSLSILTYMVMRFKSMKTSAGLFVLLLFIPGVVKYNFHFWHPDGILILLIVLTLFFLQKDQLRFKKYFYLAAMTCGVAFATKLWGAFFVTTIAGYLIAGLLKKILTFKQMIWAGIGFLFVMFAALVISSPTLLVPYIARTALKIWQVQQTALLHGFDEPDPQGVYRTGLANWLIYFDLFYMKVYIFVFSILALLAGSLWGARKYLNRIFLAWCATTGIFLIVLISMKSSQYMLPLMLPLYSSMFLFPYLVPETNEAKVRLGRAVFPIQKVLWGILILACGAQFVFNIINIAISSAVGINDFIAMLH
jgi:hypothetical protein